MAIRTKRVYEAPAPEDGHRLLVMRLWPRGVSKARVDEWEPALGPSRELLLAFRRGAVDWEEFARRYRKEVSARPELLARVRAAARAGTVTLLCGCKDESRCHRSLLRDLVT